MSLDEYANRFMKSNTVRVNMQRVSSKCLLGLGYKGKDKYTQAGLVCCVNMLTANNTDILEGWD